MNGRFVINKLDLNTLIVDLKQAEDKTWLPDLLGEVDEPSTPVDEEPADMVARSRMRNRNDTT